MNKIAFLIDECAPGTPAQQLLDRFLTGYPRDGKFYRPENRVVAVHCPAGSSDAELDRRAKDLGLVRTPEPTAALEGADAVVVVPRGSGAVAGEHLVRIALENARPGCGCFVFGALGNSLAFAQKHVELAAARKVLLLAGTPLPVTWRLPPVDLERGAPLKEALIVVQGARPNAELDGLEGLLPVIERRRGGESGIRQLTFLIGDAVWQAGENGIWPWPLLAAALSRSDTPQGDPVKDGRTQDLVGLGLLPKLARMPRAWVIEHRDGLRSTILVLDGVVADYNFAVRLRDGSVVSAQLYRPPAPAEHHFSRLAEVMENFFQTGKPPWPIERSLLEAGLLEVFATAPIRVGKPLATPGLRPRHRP